MWIDESPEMIEAGLSEGHLTSPGRRPGDPPSPGDRQYKWGDVVELGGSGSPRFPLAGARATLIQTPVLSRPRPLFVSLLFSSNQAAWSPTPAVPPGQFLLVKEHIGVDPLYGIRSVETRIGAVGDSDFQQPLWAKSATVIACKLDVSIELSQGLVNSNYQQWVAAVCTVIDAPSGESLAAERTGTNIYGFPLSTFVSALATTTPALLIAQAAWRQQFWIRNLPSAEQPNGSATVYVGFGQIPAFDGVAGIWTNYNVALEPGQTYESYPIEQGSFWGNVYVASSIAPETGLEPVVVASFSLPGST